MILQLKALATPVITAALLTAGMTPLRAQEQISQSFEFRGARLGMTIEEFETLPALSKARLSEYSDRGKKLREGLLTRCAPSKDKANAQIGVVECTRAGDDPFTFQGGRYIYTNTGYKFGPDAAGTKRLFSILIITGRENNSEAVSGLRAKWGNGKIVTSTVTNGLGQPLPQSTETWTKPNGTIELESPCGSVTTICLTYSETRLIAALANQRADVTGGVASRF